MSKPTFYLLDGNAVLHRAWHALPPLATKEGKLVNAVYGFLLVLLKLLREEKPIYLAAAFDLAGPTFRHETYEAYKATRVKAPDELYDQLPILKEILEAFGIPIFEKPGYEADDLIGTLATMVAKTGDLETVIVTGDLDTLQLVQPGVTVYTFARGLREGQRYDAAAVEKRYGLKPEQLIDFKALRGDPSDNIKGVHGIGEKTATALLQQFGSLERMYKAIKRLSNEAIKRKGLTLRLIETLKEGEADAKMAKDLVTIRCQVTVDFSLDKARVREPDREKLIPFFQSLGFQSLLAKLPGKVEEKISFQKEKKTKKKNYRLLRTADEVVRVVSQLKDTEVVALYAIRSSEDIFSDVFLGMALAWGEGRAAFVLPAHFKKLKPFFENEKIIKVGHNVKSLLHLFQSLGQILNPPFEDVMIMSYLLAPGSRAHSLSDLIFERFGRQWQEITRQGTLLPPSPEEIFSAACETADLILRLQGILKKELEDRGQEKLLREIEMPTTPILVSMERSGISVNAEYLKAMAETLPKRAQKLSQKIFKLSGQEFNLNSPAQLKKILFEKLKIPAKVRKTAGGTLSTAASELERLRGTHPIIDLIFEYRELAKLISTYVEVLPKLIHAKTHRLHTTFHQTVTATGRLSSSNPNLQNIPIRTELGRQIRQAFVAEKGMVLLSADYSQIELRLAAVMARAGKMIEAFRRGVDIHRQTAAEIWNVPPEEVTKEQRYAAKAINFGIIYGIGPVALAESAGISVPEAKEFIQRYFDLYPELQNYLDETKALALSLGYVETMFGRRRYLPEIRSGVPYIRAEAERAAINAPVQGTAADLAKLAMIKIFEWLRQIYGQESEASVRLLLQVHDALVFEVRKDLTVEVGKKIKEIMETAHTFAVPLVVEVETGRSWGGLTAMEDHEHKE
ncbi:DNA polymerase I [Candidatus Uhrbacteria bacterium]|nr:DNA polymerase I [Candidatus Uhrbacteria bacterium]